MAGMDQGLRQALNLGREETIAEVVRAGLRDRDYENLPTGGRIKCHAALCGDDKLIVCDCVDIEPGVQIYRHLLAASAAEVVEGALIVAFATGSRRVVVHVAEDDEHGAAAVAAAAQPLVPMPAQEGVAANLGATPGEVQVVRALFRRNMKGYEEVPTLLVTGETMAHVTRILRSGAEEYRSIGTAESPGSKLFQVSGSVERPGIYEAPLGTSLRTLLQDHAGGIKASPALKAVIVGGIKGVCLTPDELDVTLDFDTVRRAGGTIGSGAVAVLDETTCIVDETKRRIAVSCYDLCAACSLGREGSYQLREIVADAARGKSRGSDVEMMRELGAGMKAGAACQFGRTAPNIVLSALDKFPDEWEAHMKRKLCRALVCDQYVTFHILPDLCDGCGECVDVCPEDCIEGGRNKIHVIDQDDCVKCGRCLEVCNGLRRAVVKAGPIKPRTPKRPVAVGSWKG